MISRKVEAHAYAGWQTHAMTLGEAQPTAGSVTARQVVSQLLPALTGFEAAFLRGEYALWLGAGISRDRMPDVSKLIFKVLEFARLHVDVDDPNCPYRRLIDKAIELADLSESEIVGIDVTTPLAEWPAGPTLVRRLGRQYSTLLDVPIVGEPIDFLVWDAVDVPGTYANPDVPPDLEHYAISALIIEGVVTEIVSANWDGLVERAFAELSGGSLGLRVLIDSDDFRGGSARAEILKFHGCGIRARDNEDRYRSYLVGRRSQITVWPHDEDHVIMRKRMAEVAATKRTLMIGLSGQDTNIQDLFAQAQADFAWPWPDSAPAVLFAEDAVGIDQQNILRVVYRAGYEPHGHSIDSGSLVRAYSKPLLAALFAMTLASKLEGLARLAAPSINTDDGSVAMRGMRAYFAQRMGTDTETRALLSDVGRAMMLFSNGALPAPFGRYVPLSSSPTDHLEADPMLNASGLPQAALALVALAAEHRRGSWELSAETHDADSLGPVLQIDAGGRIAKVWFVANASSAVKLEMTGFIGSDDEESVVISSDYEVFGAQRSPSADIGRTGHAGIRRVHMPELVASASSFDEVREALRGGIGL